MIENSTIRNILHSVGGVIGGFLYGLLPIYKGLNTFEMILICTISSALLSGFIGFAFETFQRHTTDYNTKSNDGIKDVFRFVIPFVIVALLTVLTKN